MYIFKRTDTVFVSKVDGSIQGAAGKGAVAIFDDKYFTQERVPFSKLSGRQQNEARVRLGCQRVSEWVNNVFGDDAKCAWIPDESLILRPNQRVEIFNRTIDLTGPLGQFWPRSHYTVTSWMTPIHNIWVALIRLELLLPVSLDPEIDEAPSIHHTHESIALWEV